MRRLVSVLLVVVMSASGLLTGCGGKSPLAKKPVSPFTTEYELDEGAVDFFVAGDTFETAASGGPFYAGAQPLPGQNDDEYTTARAAKIAEINAEAAALVTACDEAKPALAALRSGYTTFLEGVYKKEAGLKDPALESLNTVVLLGSKGLLAEEQYAAIVSQETTQSYATAMRDYVAVTKAVELGGIYLEDVNTVTGYAALMVEALGGSKDAAVSGAANAFDSEMETLAGDALAALEPIVQRLANVEAGLTQLASADYYYSLEAIGWMQAESAKLSPLVEGLEAREGLSAEDVEGIKAFYAAFEEWDAALSEQVASIDTTGLIEISSAPFPVWGPEAAYAAADYEPGKNYGAANQVLATSAESKPPAKGWLASGWDGIKSGFGKVKTGVGVTVDTLGLGVRNITSVGAGIYYGNSTKDIVDNVMANTKEVVDNYNKGVSGASTFKNANDYIEGVETGAGDAAGGAAEWGIEKIWGKGKISSGVGWATGGLTKITVGMFTGMAKGIYKVSNTESSSADVALGFIEIGLGAIGGSKVIIKASQLPGLLKGGAQGVKAFQKIATGMIGSAANAAERKTISKALAELLVKKGFTPENATKLVSNSIKLEINAAVGQLIKNSRDAMIKKIRDLVAQGGTGALTNFKDTIKSSLQDLLSKGFSKTMQGYLNAGTTVMGETMKDYVDNLVAAGVTDGLLVNLIGQAMAIPPDPAQVSGTWTGSITILKVDIPESESKTAEEAGCEQTFKQLEGKKNACTYAITMGDSGSGTVVLSGGTVSGSGSATYSDGVITMVVGSEGTTYTMKGTIAFAKSGGMTMNGSWRAPFQGSTIIMSGSFTGTK